MLQHILHLGERNESDWPHGFQIGQNRKHPFRLAQNPGNKLLQRGDPLSPGCRFRQCCQFFDHREGECAEVLQVAKLAPDRLNARRIRFLLRVFI